MSVKRDHAEASLALARFAKRHGDRTAKWATVSRLLRDSDREAFLDDLFAEPCARDSRLCVGIVADRQPAIADTAWLLESLPAG